MHIPTTFRVILAALAVLALAACGELAGTGDPNVAATVNGTEIPVSAVEQRFEQARNQPQLAQQLEADADGTFRTEVQAQILSQLVVTELLEQWADDLDIDATEEEVQQEREELVEQLGGEEAFQQAVEESGLSEEDVELQMRQRVLQDKIADSVTADVDIAEEDIAAFYEENADERFGERAGARHILVEDRALANRLLSQLEDGADFAELAQEHSTDQGSGAQGGDLGEFGRGQMVPEFEEAVFSAEEGELVGPVQTQYGFHIIEVTSRQEAQDLDEVRDEIRDELTQSQEGDLLQQQLRERTEDAVVTVNPRFGTWNPETGQVEPESPLGDTTETPGAGGTETGDPSATEMPPIEAPTE
ncbi:MAG TPA: peptidylprolyl isomerase [Egibacteraceae bacterium]|nr:peptidylprolyl isomerase [Egibacteraceae bacterium]